MREIIVDGRNYVEMDCLCVHETDMAVLLSIGGEEVWIPKSQLEDWPDVGIEGDVIMTEWIAKEKELI